jgi:hypothetical protein
MLNAVGEMEKVLNKYYQKTSFPSVCGDGMILNLRTKLIIFEEEFWVDSRAEEYSNACGGHFIQMYDQSNDPDIPSSFGWSRDSTANTPTWEGW